MASALRAPSGWKDMGSGASTPESRQTVVQRCLDRGLELGSCWIQKITKRAFRFQIIKRGYW